MECWDVSLGKLYRKGTASGSKSAPLLKISTQDTPTDPCLGA